VKAKVRKVLIGVTGGVVLLVGVVMILLPGPAILVIPAGLAILATEFQWAHHLNTRIKDKIKAMREKRQKKVKTAQSVLPKAL
jgi:uncharacterized protein (TIGR02611 family)